MSDPLPGDKVIWMREERDNLTGGRLVFEVPATFVAKRGKNRYIISMKDPSMTVVYKTVLMGFIRKV